MKDKAELRNQLARMLSVRQAHMAFEDAVADFPMEQINTRPANCDYSFWHLLEHLRIAQRDIVDYIQSAEYHWPDFPDGYWPDKSTAADGDMWGATIEQFIADRNELVKIVQDPAVDLFAPLVNSGEHEHNILR